MKESKIKIMYMYKMNQMNKTDLYCTKCLNVTDDSTNV